MRSSCAAQCRCSSTSAADTLNIDEALVEAAITPRTKAICVVHYAGVSCEMDAIMAIAQRHGLAVVEDAAQGIFSTYRGKPLGTFGGLGALSFHETKNVISGEGGALLVNDEALLERAEIIREKGTNRSQFFRGQVDKYTWVDVGSSYLPGEIIAAFLAAQLEDADAITRPTHVAVESVPRLGRTAGAAAAAAAPDHPAECMHNAHMYYLLLPSLEARTHFIDRLKEQGIGARVPLHPAALLSSRQAPGSYAWFDVGHRRHQ